MRKPPPVEFQFKPRPRPPEVPLIAYGVVFILLVWCLLALHARLCE